MAAALRARGVPSVMYGPDENWREPADDGLFHAWLPRPWVDSGSDARGLVEACRIFGARVAVIDDYRVDDEYQLCLREHGLTWMQQFNASSPPAFWGDWIVNAGPGETAARYIDHVKNPQATFLLGPEYAVLRPEFRGGGTELPSGRVSRILLSFGGGDDQGLVIRLLSALIADGPPDVEFRVMSGKRNPRNDSISEWINYNAQGRVTLSVNPSDVVAEYRACQLAIIGGGTSTFEAAALGLPMIIVAMADNQNRQAVGWEERHAAVFAGGLDTLSLEGLVIRVTSLCADPARVAEMSRAGVASVDGGGCERLVQRLVGVI
ncbi:hypothetical protein EGY25_06360 [Brevundimonas intermedia]|uniref:Glycosyl transferase family 28 C-terminal domain-containing protein n=1 Tax=Brevundimonas intermedia TaxID=74315 RepID=A0A4Y9RX51_9CAUL|nr:hypothetical protein [Brevundimonas intermedia]TFW13552.1 hypothetical protein EGY25_06360 [Brevundimonas intermedia]